MAKKLIKLSAIDIILQADAETIREAYESRVKIDDLLEKREEAYRQIEAIELQVEELVGEEGEFIYPEPPGIVAGFNKPVPAARPKPKAPPKPKPEEPKKVEEPVEEPPPETASEDVDSPKTDESKAVD